MKILLTIGMGLCITAAVSCKRTCIDQDDMTIEEGETVRFTSCTDYPRAYTWLINSEPLSAQASYSDGLFGGLFGIFLDSTSFSDYRVIEGGWYCDDFVEVEFIHAGIYTFTQGTSRKITEGSCESGNFKTSDYHERSITVTVL
ncbi:MAG: hypothetical protein HQ500_05500 [Flavobacteriales bacterium]|nr:hypothetical protein [Flavobacteriales bacterium]